MNAAAVCPYCRGPIEPESERHKICEGCGTPHHADCYEENAGCTVFGCSFAPAEEPELSISRTDLANTPRTAAPTISVAPTTLGLTRPVAVQAASAAPPVRVKAPPPPLPQSAAPVVTTAPAPAVAPRRLSTLCAPSVLFGTQLAPEPTSAPASAPTPTFATAAATASPYPVASEFVPDAKNRTTFIVLGVLLGFVGAHNFCAGYKKKAIIQLCITVLTLGFAAPMIWVWAVIDVCTVDRDSKGTKFTQ